MGNFGSYLDDFVQTLSWEDLRCLIAWIFFVSVLTLSAPCLFKKKKYSVLDTCRCIVWILNFLNGRAFICLPCESERCKVKCNSLLWNLVCIFVFIYIFMTNVLYLFIFSYLEKDFCLSTEGSQKLWHGVARVKLVLVLSLSLPPFHYSQIYWLGNLCCCTSQTSHFLVFASIAFQTGGSTTLVWSFSCGSIMLTI